MEDLKNIIADNIASLRKKNGMTQADLAERLCYSDKAISKWERGESIPDVIILKAVADTFSVTIDYLLTPHDGDEAPSAAEKKEKKKNRLLISAVSAGSVWLFATLLFVLFTITDVTLPVGNYMIFIYAVPVCLVVCLVFASVWGNKTHRAVIVSLLIWSVLACICLTVGTPGIWLLMTVGVPGEIVTLLSFGIGRRKE